MNFSLRITAPHRRHGVDLDDMQDRPSRQVEPSPGNGEIGPRAFFQAEQGVKRARIVKLVSDDGEVLHPL